MLRLCLPSARVIASVSLAALANSGSVKVRSSKVLHLGAGDGGRRALPRLQDRIKVLDLPGQAPMLNRLMAIVRDPQWRHELLALPEAPAPARPQQNAGLIDGGEVRRIRLWLPVVVDDATGPVIAVLEDAVGIALDAQRLAHLLDL